MSDKFAAMELAVDEPSRMTIYHPGTGQPLVDGEGKEAWIDLLSLDSHAAKTYERKITTQRLSARVRQQITAEQIEAEHTGRLAAITVGWRLLGFDGSDLAVPFSTSSAQDLYSNPARAWLREQVETYLANRANFIKGSPKS